MMSAGHRRQTAVVASPAGPGGPWGPQRATPRVDVTRPPRRERFQDTGGLTYIDAAAKAVTLIAALKGMRSPPPPSTQHSAPLSQHHPFWTQWQQRHRHSGN